MFPVTVILNDIDCDQPAFHVYYLLHELVVNEKMWARDSSGSPPHVKILSPSIMTRLGPNSIEIFWLEKPLEFWLEISLH